MALTAAPQAPADVEIAPGLLMPAATLVTDDDYRGYRVEAIVTPDRGRLVVSTLTVHRLDDGTPVTGEGLRQIALTPFIKAALSAAYSRLAAVPHDDPVAIEAARQRAAAGQVAWGLLNIADRDRLKAAGPTEETLRWVALLYRVAVAVAEPPVKTVQGAFGVSLRTATNWVAAARRTGLLESDDGER